MDMRMVNGKGKRGRGSDGLRCGSTSGAGRLTRCRRHLECALWQRWHLCAAPWPMRTPRRVGAVERSFETRARGSGLECDAACVPGPGRACLTLRRDPRWVCAARARRSSRRRRPSGRRRRQQLIIRTRPRAICGTWPGTLLAMCRHGDNTQSSHLTHDGTKMQRTLSAFEKLPFRFLPRLSGQPRLADPTRRIG